MFRAARSIALVKTVLGWKCRCTDPDYICDSRVRAALHLNVMYPSIYLAYTLSIQTWLPLFFPLPPERGKSSNVDKTPVVATTAERLHGKGSSSSSSVSQLAWKHIIGWGGGQGNDVQNKPRRSEQIIHFCFVFLFFLSFVGLVSLQNPPRRTIMYIQRNNK